MRYFWIVVTLLSFLKCHAQQLISQKVLMDNDADYWEFRYFDTLRNGNILKFSDVYMEPDISIWDQNGNLLHRKHYQDDMGYPIYVTDITKTDDGSLVTCGKFKDTAVITRYDSTGNFVKMIPITGIGNDEAIREVVEINNSYYIVTNKFDFTGYSVLYDPFGSFPYYRRDGFFKVYLKKVNQNGAVIQSIFLNNTLTGFIVDASEYGVYPGSNIIPDDTYAYLWNKWEGNSFLNSLPGKDGLTYSFLQTTVPGWDVFGSGQQYSEYLSCFDTALNLIRFKTIFENQGYFEPGWVSVYPYPDRIITASNSFRVHPNADTFICKINTYSPDVKLIYSLVKFSGFLEYNFPEAPFNIQGGPYYHTNSTAYGEGYINSYFYHDTCYEESQWAQTEQHEIYGLSYYNAAFDRTWDIHFPDILEKDHYAILNPLLFTGRDGNLRAVVTINAGLSFQHTLYTFKPNGNIINVSAFIDDNNNGEHDSTESNAVPAYAVFKHNNHSENLPLTYAYNLQHCVDTGIFTSELVSYAQRLHGYTILPAKQVSHFSSYGNVDTVEFRIVKKINYPDLQVCIIPISGVRPGFKSTYDIKVSNAGSNTVQNIHTYFVKDPVQTFDTSVTNNYTFSGDTVLWNIDSLSTGENLTLKAAMINPLPPDFDSGDTVTYYAAVFPAENDSFPSDNYFILRQDVTNSYDPNDKMESHGGHLTAEQLLRRDFLYYTIRFQNTGSDYASIVTIKDTLSDKLDWSTFEMVATSLYSYTIDVKDGRYITWKADIYLPSASENEPASHGYITFRIKPKTGLSMNDEITNRAAIILDYNLAVITNTVSTSIIDERVTLVHNKEIKTLKLYPTPTSGNIMLEMNITQAGNYELQLTDITGQIIYSETLDLSAGAFSKQINLENLAANMYLLSIRSQNNEVYSGKILKQ